MNNHSFPQTLTYNDVSLIPAYSEVLPSQVEVRVALKEGFYLHAPFLSAAMDTVTTSQMAIALAQNGGLGVIHKNLSIGEQAEEVYRVKKYEAGVIKNPVTIGPDTTALMAKELMSKHGVNGFPVVRPDGKLLGILTRRDIRLCEKPESRAQDIMSTNLVVGEQGANYSLCLALMKERKVEKLPLVDASGILQGLVTLKDMLKVTIYPFATRDKASRLCCAAAVGPSTDLEERAHALVKAGCDVLVVDTAHGHSKFVGQATKFLRQWFPDLVIVAGNVVTAEGARFLAEQGADVVKVGIGPGSTCTTRITAGVGVPQLSSILDVGQEAKKGGFRVIADGGIQYSGDCVKALAAGAHAVMIGSLFAGTQEAPGEQILFGGRRYKIYRGMGSLGAMERGSKERYGQNEVTETSKLVPQGIEGRIPFRGSVADTLYQLVGGLRAGMGYLGAQNINELQDKARFVRLTSFGQRESHVHDISITKEAPNYFFQD